MLHKYHHKNNITVKESNSKCRSVVSDQQDASTNQGLAGDNAEQSQALLKLLLSQI